MSGGAAGDLDNLDVWITDHLGLRRVGALLRICEAGSVHQSNVAFRYDAGLQAHDAVSLRMPVSTVCYSMPVSGHVHILHPIFDQTLPEGALKDYLTGVYAKIVPDMGDFDMLRLLAGEAIGRVRVVPRSATPGAARDNTSELNTLLAAPDSHPVMAALTQDRAQYSSVAGVQLKVLARGVLNIRTVSVPRASMTDQWIVKSSGDTFPWLAANEFLCMNAAAKGGLSVPNVHLSEDRQTLLVDRFDIDPDGNPLGFEDIACLTGRLSHQRYEGTYEEVASAICQWVTADNRADALGSFFKALVFSCGIENGDAHLKNFGIIYRDPSASVALAPIYDLVCTTAYLKEDQLALPLNGSRRFPTREALESFGTAVCGLSVETVQRTFDTVFLAVDDLSIAVANFSNEDEDFERQCGAPMMASLIRSMRRTFRLNREFLPSGFHLMMRALPLD